MGLGPKCVGNTTCALLMTRRFGINSQSKYWCATLNNYDEEDFVYLTLIGEKKLHGMTYCIVGREVGQHGTPHLQCYFEFDKKKRFSTVKKLCERFHLEARKGTSEEASEYCKKDGDFVEFGTLSESVQGSRSDLDVIADRIREGASRRTIALEFPVTFMRMYRGIDALISIYRQRRNVSVFPELRWNVRLETAHIFWGAAGCGKTEFAKQLLPEALFVTHLDDLKDYDPSVYTGLVFDDMSFLHLPREAQIHLIDYDNPRSIHVRYGVAHIPAGTIKVFTTNVFQGKIFLEDAAILRRLHFHHLE